jgi:hypothetical protein
MAIDAGTAAILGAGISGICSAITAIGVVAFTKRSDERQHMREISINTAIEEWKFARELAATHGGKLPPIDVYIMHMVMLSKFLGKNDLSGESIAQFMHKLGSLTDESIGAAEAVMEERQQKLKAKLKAQAEARAKSGQA